MRNTFKYFSNTDPKVSINAGSSAKHFFLKSELVKKSKCFFCCNFTLIGLSCNFTDVKKLYQYPVYSAILGKNYKRVTLFKKRNRKKKLLKFVSRRMIKNATFFTTKLHYYIFYHFGYTLYCGKYEFTFSVHVHDK